MPVAQLNPAEIARIPLLWLKGIPTPIFLLSGNGKIWFCNDAFLELLGYREEEVLGAGLDALVGPSDITEVLKDTLNLYEGRGLRRASYAFLQKNGKEVRTFLDISPLYGTGTSMEVVTNAIGIVHEYARQA